MKKRVYKIKDKILVQGDENLLTEDEVLVKEENGSVVLKERVNGEVINIVTGGGDSNIEDMLAYYDLSPLTLEDGAGLALQSVLIKASVGGDVIVSPGYIPGSTPIAVGIDFNINIITAGSNNKTTLKDYLKVIGMYDTIINLPTLTKEEFYTI